MNHQEYEALQRTEIERFEQGLIAVIRNGGLGCDNDTYNDFADHATSLRDDDCGSQEDIDRLAALLAHWHYQLTKAGILEGKGPVGKGPVNAADVLSLFKNIYLRTEHFRLAADDLLRWLQGASAKLHAVK